MKQICVLIFLFWQVVAMAQPFHFSVFDTQDGLLSSEVTTLYEDQQGYLWIGTPVGLSRYNGYEFKNYTTGDGLPAGQIRGIGEDATGTLWVATTSGLAFLQNDNFQSVRFADELQNESLWVLHFSPQGDLWMGTDSRISVLRKEKLALAQQKIDTSFFQHFQLDVDVNVISSDSTGNIYFTDFDQLICYDGEHFKEIGESAEDAIMSIFPLKNDTVLVGNRTGYIYKIANNFKEKYTPYQRDSYDALAIHDYNNRRWILDQNGIKIIANEQQIYQYSLYENEGIKLLICMIRDREGNFWLGSREGLIKMTSRDFTFHPQVTELVKNGIFSLGENAAGELVIGGNTKTNLVRNAAGDYRKIPVPARFPRGEIYDVLLDHQDDLWLLSNWDGVVRYHSGEQVDYWFYEEGIELGVDMFCLTQDREKNLWIGHTAGVSRLEMDWEADTMRNIINYSERAGLAKTQTNQIVQDKFGTIWFGTSTGLYFYKNDSIQLFQLFDNQPNIIDLAIDEFNQLWIATQGKGLLQYKITREQKLELLANYHAKNGLASDFLLSIAINQTGDVWLGSYLGISVLKKQAEGYHPINYNAADGLFDKAYQNIRLYNDQQNVIWAATSMGLLSFDPAAIKINHEPPLLHLDDIEILDQPLGNRKPIALKHTENRITFNYTAVSLKNPAKIRYRYQLQGLQETWSNDTKDRTVTFNNLHPGDYVFRLMAYNNDYIPTEQPLEYRFQINPPFWQRAWFIAAVILFILATAYAFYRYRIAQIRKSERERSRVQQMIAELETKALRAQMNPHFIFNCLNAIQECIITGQVDAAYEYLYKFSRLMRRVLNSSSKSLIAVEEEIEILQLYLELEALRFDDKFSYDIDVDDMEETGEMLLPSLMVQPFVENAIWHGLMHKKGKSKLQVRFSSDEELLICTIEDNGVGRAKAQELKASRKFKTQSQALKMVSDRLKIIAAQSKKTAEVEIIDLIENDEATGTRVVLRLPNDL
ncbi:MAG: two-component regulator propeller domain-containing protein [Saprospiraceae bacterium]